MASDERSYTQEQVNAILRRALEHQDVAAEGVSHDELMATAAEVGIEPAALEAAIAAEAGLAVRASERARLVEEWKAERLARARRGWFAYAFVNALLLVIGLVTGHVSMLVWTLGPWGLVLLLRSVRLGRAPTDTELRAVAERSESEAQRGRARLALRGRMQRGEAGAPGAVAAGSQPLVDEGAARFLSHLGERKKLAAVAQSAQATAGADAGTKLP